MQDCETFIRGTIRFGGFSNVISAFHDIGLTSDDPVPSPVKTLRNLADARFNDFFKGKTFSIPAEAQRVLNKIFMDETEKNSAEYKLLAKFCGVNTSHIPV